MVRLLVPALVTLSACGGYIGAGPAPQLSGVQRPMSVEIKVQGDERDTVEDALRWLLSGNRSVRRVSTGGDARVTIGGKLKQERAILAGTDCSWKVQLLAVGAGGEELVKETREFKADGLSSNVSLETEKLITKSVVWALERSSSGLSAPPPPPPQAATPVTTPSVEPDETPPPIEPAAPVRKKARKRR